VLSRLGRRSNGGPDGQIYGTNLAQSNCAPRSTGHRDDARITSFALGNRLGQTGAGEPAQSAVRAPHWHGHRLSLHLPGTLSSLFAIVALTNIGLAIFNLIPLPPLDGYGVVQGILASIRGPTSYRLSQNLAVLEQQGPFLLFLLILAGQFMGLNLLGRFMDPFVSLLSRLILGL
jgi:Zn-dependent protease